VAESFGRRTLVIPLPLPLVRTIAAASEAISWTRRQPTVVNLDKVREVAAGSWVCSAQAAADELGFVVGAPLMERLRQTAQWYRDQRWL
jgi:dihydroflavonol-4-reductase